MSPTDHEHTWAQAPASTFPDLRCTVCGASHTAIQDMLGEAADDATRLVGEAYYTGCRVRQELEKLELWLFDPPASVLEELEAIRPGVYLIHTDAPRSPRTLDDLRDSLDWAAWRAEGVEVHAVGPSEDGYLEVGVEGDLEAARVKLDAAYGNDVVRVFECGPMVPAIVHVVGAPNE